jgi:deazaflavin-dependent oxidoreductase (nitroreductase family)
MYSLYRTYVRLASRNTFYLKEFGEGFTLDGTLISEKGYVEAMGNISTTAALGYEHKPPNAAQRVLQKFAASKPGAWTFHKTLHPIDRWLYKRTNGRITAPGILAGLPVVLLTTTGAKSGQQRTMPLIAVPVDDALAVIGSNFGQERTPGWVYNLEANPKAAVAYGESSIDVVAELATQEQEDRVFELAEPIYVGYQHYRERASHRDIRVFLLRIAD